MRENSRGATSFTPLRAWDSERVTITYRAEYSGHIDGERVAWTYRAYDEEGAPYVLVLDHEVGPITLVQAPTEFLDGVEDDEVDRQNAIYWVHRLAELVDKARALDAIVEIVDSAFDTDDMAHDIQVAVDAIHEHVGEEDLDDDDDDDDEDDAPSLNWPSIFHATADSVPTVTAKVWLPSDDGALTPHPAFVVDELTDAETDSEWIDVQDDHYKYIDGEWHISYEGDDPWTTFSDRTFLNEYGPYTAVGR